VLEQGCKKRKLSITLGDIHMNVLKEIDYRLKVYNYVMLRRSRKGTKCSHTMSGAGVWVASCVDCTRNILAVAGEFVLTK
jgi:hypothetical protein